MSKTNYQAINILRKKYLIFPSKGFPCPIIFKKDNDKYEREQLFNHIVNYYKLCGKIFRKFDKKTRKRTFKFYPNLLFLYRKIDLPDDIFILINQYLVKDHFSIRLNNEMFKRQRYLNYCQDYISYLHKSKNYGCYHFNFFYNIYVYICVVIYICIYLYLI
jgi:hypothetical protein